MAHPGDGGHGDVVVVPHRPGPLVRPDAPARRGRDDLDELIDELLPDTDERPGWFDAAVVLGGACLLGWALLAGGPRPALVVGAIAVGLGSILPVRAVWRGAGRRRRGARLASGTPLRFTDAEVRRLVEAYDDLLLMAGGDGSGLAMRSMAAAHGALAEVATLLEGRSPEGDRELAYVSRRASAIEGLVAAVGDGADGRSTAALLDARDEVDAIGGVGSVARIDELVEEVRAKRGGG